jgi:hypothetical protein
MDIGTEGQARIGSRLLRGSRWHISVNVFFEPVEFDLELPDLLIQLGSERRLSLSVACTARREDFGQTFNRLFFSLRHLMGMEAVVGGDFVDGALTFERFQGDFDLEGGGGRFALLLHDPP